MGGAERGRRKGGEAKQSRVVERSEIGGERGIKGLFLNCIAYYDEADGFELREAETAMQELRSNLSEIPGAP